MISPCFYTNFTHFYCSVEQLHRNVHRRFETFWRPWYLSWPHLYRKPFWKTWGWWTCRQKGQWQRCMPWTSTSRIEWIISQDIYKASDKYFFWSSQFIEPLHYNFCYFLGSSWSRYHQILIKSPHLNCPSCVNTSWIGVGNFLHNMWLPIDKRNQLLCCMLRLSGMFWSHQRVVPVPDGIFISILTC